MARRDLLHVSKLDAFKRYLTTKSIPYREGKGDYQVMQVYYKNKWIPIYRRNEMPEHFSIHVEMCKLVRDFIANI